MKKAKLFGADISSSMSKSQIRNKHRKLSS